MSRFTKIDHQPRRLADEVYGQLLDGILEGDIEPGERLIQEALAGEMTVSRTPVREALLRLEREGIIEPAERRGFLVVDLSSETIRDLYQARQAVEGFAARLIAERGTEEAIDRLRAVLQREITASHPTDVYDEKRLIHREVVDATGNPALLELFDSLWGKARALALMAHGEPNDRVVASWRVPHTELLVAIESRNGEKAERIMVEPPTTSSATNPRMPIRKNQLFTQIPLTTSARCVEQDAT